MGALRKKIRIPATGNEYTIQLPTGRIGAIQTAIFLRSEIEPKDESEALTKEDREALAEAFEEWSAKVLPHILIDKKYDEIPGEDQFALFIAVSSFMRSLGESSDEFFQVIE